jgi:hypothetical protein
MVGRELRSELIDVVCGSSEARKENQRPACATPIEEMPQKYL